MTLKLENSGDSSISSYTVSLAPNGLPIVGEYCQ